MPLARTHSVAAAVARTVELAGPSTVYIGFSGGMDSTALLLAACEVAEHARLPVCALHANHGLHPEADEWQQHCLVVCERLGVPLRHARVDVARDGNLEAAARDARYAFYAEHLEPADLLLLGHHQQDQTELLLLRLLQGRGLLPMRHGGRLGEGRFARPLLDVDPQQLADYVRHSRVAWVEDPSNADLTFDRNYLRHAVLPQARSRWPRMAGRLGRVAAGQQRTDAALRHALATLGDEFMLDILPAEVDTGIAWLRAYLAGRGVFDVADRGLRGFMRALRSDQGAALQGTLDRRGWRLQRYRDRIYFEFQHPSISLPEKRLSLGARLELAHGALSVEPGRIGDALAFEYPGPMRVAFRRGGEVLLSGNRRIPLREVFHRGGVPPWRRDTYPLLFAAGQLVGVPNLAARQAAGGQLCVARWVPG